MLSYRDFAASLLPGNYALTKSMELTKVQSSGTLWYMKKFLVLYYYVFLSNEIETREYIPKVRRCFDSYIASLPPQLREDARSFFYPQRETVRFDAPGFRPFSVFAGQLDFEGREERAAYYQRAKKCYFTTLMDSGGQGGVKKLLKEEFQRPDFVYSRQAVTEAVFSAALESAAGDCAERGAVRDRSVKYILSRSAIEAAESLTREGRAPGVEEMRRLAERFPHEKPAYAAIENDVTAFIRNERQILYYYGFCHSRSSGAEDMEFSSLTPVGEMALSANADEFLAIWEHQKLKMISQPPTADIYNIPHTEGGSFDISFAPYLDILSCLERRGEMSGDEYQYIISRLWGDGSQEPENEIFERMDELRAAVGAFGRRGDIAPEDSRKELKKYLLGVRNDLPLDRGCCPLGFCSLRHDGVQLENAARGSELLRIYRKLNAYKQQRWGRLFERCRDELARRYAAAREGHSAPLAPEVKIHWDLYNIHPDSLILLGVMIAMARLSGAGDAGEFAFARMPGLLRQLGIGSAAAARRALERAQAAMDSGDYEAYAGEPRQNLRPDAERWRTMESEALFRRIQETSSRAQVEYDEGRRRNTALIGMLKAYYISRFEENGTLRCECCSREAFLTRDGTPYLEFHHLAPFGEVYGPDHYLNIFALCPSCHRMLHYLPPEAKAELYRDLSAGNYLHLDIVRRLRSLKEERLIRSYHLEYLLVDRAITQEEYNAIAA